MKNRAVICIGMSLSLLVGIFVLWGGLPLTQVTGLGISDILKFWSIPSVLAITCALSLTLLKKQLPRSRFLVGASLLAGSVLLGGYALLFIGNAQQSASLITTVFAAILTGFGYSTLLILWQHHLSQLSRDEVAQTLLLSLVGCSALYLILVGVLHNNAWYAFPFILVAAVVCCLLAVKLPALRNDTMKPLKSRRTVIAWSFAELRNPLLCVGAIAFAVALTRAIALDGIEDADLVNIVSSISIIAVSLVLYLLWFKFDFGNSWLGKLNIQSLYQLCFPLIATALLALSVIGSSLSLVVTTLVYTVFSLVNVLIMLTSIDSARKHQVWPAYVYGVFAGTVYLVFAAATALGAWVYYPKNFGVATFSIIVLVVLYILAMSYVAIKNRRRAVEEDGFSSNDESTKAKQDSPAAVIDEVARRCTILIQQHQLTARESEILLLIAKGRDVPSIAKQLFISENTVRSHSKSVYRKLDIHSKQELLDLLETL